MEQQRALLSALKRRPALLDDLRLEPRDFTGAYALAFCGLRKLIEEGKQPDDILLVDSGVPAGVVVELDLPDLGNAAYYAGELRDAAKRRGLYGVAAALTDMLRTGEPTDAVVERTERGLAEVSGDTHTIKHVREVILEAVRSIETRFELQGGLAGLTTGYAKLDRHLLGFREGQLIVLAARAAIGKTALALSMCARMAAKGIRVGFIELEMTRAEISERLLSSEGRFDLRQVQTGQVNFARVTEGAERLYCREIWLDDSSKATISDIGATVRTMVRRGAQVVFIDQLTLIGAGAEYATMYERTGAVVLALKVLARTCRVPIVVLHQLNREAEGQEPSLAHLAESGQIEQHADVVLLLHRPRDNEEGMPVESKLIIGKARNSQTGIVRLLFVPRYVTFEEPA